MIHLLPLLAVALVAAAVLVRRGAVRLSPLHLGLAVLVLLPFVVGSSDALTLAIALLLATLLLSRAETRSVRRLSDRIFTVLFAAYAAAAVVWLVAGFLPFLARVSPAAESTFARWGGGVVEASVTALGDEVSGDDAQRDLRDVAMTFNPPRLALRADADVRLHVLNRHPGVAHNLSIYTDASLSRTIHRGQLIPGPASYEEPTRSVEAFHTPAGGTYYLRCDLHPWMNGAVTVTDAPSGPGTWPVVGTMLRNATTAELGALFADVPTPSTVVVALEFLFSVLNVTLGVLLMRLRPRDTAARLLALGMIGTGAVFNAEVHTALAVAPWLEAVHWSAFHGVAGFTYLLAVMVFPDGRLWPAWSDLPWWRLPLRALYLAFAFVVGSFTIGDTHALDPGDFIFIFGLLIPVFGIGAQIGRYRHATSEVERRQSRLLLTTLIAALAGAATYALLVGALSLGGDPAQVGQLRQLVLTAFPALFAAIPLLLFAILVRFRLWDIDRFLNRTFVYGALASFIGLVYVGVVVLGSEYVVGGRRGDVWLSILATAIVAVAFQPLRERLRGVANRLVYGERETPYEVLSRFSRRVAGTQALDEVLPRMAQVIGEATNASSAVVWSVADGALVPVASWPPDAAPDGVRVALRDPYGVPLAQDGLPPLPDVDHAVPVSHRAELLGALTVSKPHAEALTPAERGLLNDLAAQAGLVLRNVRLTQELRTRLGQIARQAEELRASRQRIVATQDAERRRMERDIHDGAQQHLVALAVKLRLARSMVERDPDRAAAMLSELRRETDEALDTLRNLARGIYPAVLGEQGLGAALRAHAARLPLRVEIDDRTTTRQPEEVETAVYFCCTEALQNAAKYADADVARVELVQEHGALRFTVTDDGRGFDPATVTRGRGLHNLSDRIAALDGAVTVTSRPGAGTIVEGRVPIRVLEPVT